MALLEVKNLVKEFGGVRANNDISLRIERGAIVGLIGPNGAGKTTLFNCIAGYYRLNTGKIFFKEKDITGFKPFQVNQEGIARTFQVTKTLSDLTLLENVMIGAFCRIDERELAREKAFEILELVGLEKERNAYPREMPVAIQKRIELARALATEPELLMLDEIIAGLNQKETEDAVSLLREIHQAKGLTLFLTEHVMEAIMPLSERVIVLDGGKKIAEGKPGEIATNEQVIRAYSILGRCQWLSRSG